MRKPKIAEIRIAQKVEQRAIHEHDEGRFEDVLHEATSKQRG